MNERFTRTAERITETLGRWWVTTGALGVFGVWLAGGVPMGFSDSWQLWGNTPTTWFELFTGLLALAAANRIEARMHAQQRHIETLLEHVAALVEREAPDVAAVRAELAQERQWMRMNNLAPLKEA